MSSPRPSWSLPGGAFLAPLPVKLHSRFSGMATRDWQADGWWEACVTGAKTLTLLILHYLRKDQEVFPWPQAGGKRHSIPIMICVPLLHEGCIPCTDARGLQGSFGQLHRAGALRCAPRLPLSLRVISTPCLAHMFSHMRGCHAGAGVVECEAARCTGCGEQSQVPRCVESGTHIKALLCQALLSNAQALQAVQWAEGRMQGCHTGAGAVQCDAARGHGGCRAKLNLCQVQHPPAGSS